MNNKCIRRAAVVALFLAAATPAAAVDLFWVGVNTNWLDPNAGGAGVSNWALSSGGAAQGNIPNVAGESAVIDLNGSIVSLSSSLSIDRLDVLNAGATFSMRGFSGANNVLTLAANSQNVGTVNLTAEGAGAGFGQISMAGGSTFNNSGNFNFALPVSGTNLVRNFSGLFVNSGSVNVAAQADFTSTAPATNTGTFTVVAGGQVSSSAAGVFNQNGGTLTNNGSFLFTSGDTFNFNGGNITGNAIEIQSSTLNIGAGSSGTGSFRFINNNNHNGNVAAAQTLIISGFSGINTTLTAGTFANAGNLNFTAEGSGAGFAQLAVTGGNTLTNNGNINFQPPVSGINTSRLISGNLTSNGSMNVLAGVVATFAGTSSTTTNNGTVAVAATGTINFGTTGIFTQAGGTITNNGAFQLDGDTFNFTGGTTTGNAISLNNSTLNLSAGAGAGLFVFTNASNTLTGNAKAGQVLTIFGPTGVNTTVTAPASFSSAATIDFTTNGGGSGFSQLVISGGNTMTNTGTINFKTPTGGGNNSRLLNGNFTSSGTVNVENGAVTTFNGTGSTYASSGSFNVAAGGTLNFGSGGIFSLTGGTLSNLGTVQLDGDTFNFSGGAATGNAIQLNNSALNLSAGAGGAQFVFTNPSNTLTGNVKAGQTLTVFAPAGVNTTVTASASFSSAGIVDLFASGGGSGISQLVISGVGNTFINTGTVNFRTPTNSGNNSRFLNGNFTNNGTVNVETATVATLGGTGSTYTNNGSFNVAAGGTLNFGSAGVFTLSGGTLSNLGSFQLDADTFNFSGGATTGNPVSLNNSTLNLSGGAGGGQFQFLSPSNTLTGNTKVGQTITVFAPAGINTNVTAPASFVSAGAIDLLASGGGSGVVRLTIANGGTLTNTGTVTMRTPVSSGNNSRFIGGNLINNGTVTVEANTASAFDGTNATTTNNGMFTVNATGAVTFGSGSIFTQAAGTLANNGSFIMEGDTFNFNGGQTTGTAIVLFNSTLNNGPGVNGPGRFLMNGTGNLNGNIGAAEVVAVTATPGVNTNITATTLTNFGTLELRADGGGTGVTRLTIPAPQVLINNGQLGFKSPVGGGSNSRALAGNLVNNGTLVVEGSTATEFDGTNATTTNNGTFTINAAAAVTFGSGSVFTQAAGTLTNNGAFNMNGDTFNFNGGQTLGNALVLLNSTLNNGPAATGPGNFLLNGTGNLNGNIAPGQTVAVTATPGVNTNVTATSLTNNGTLVLSTTGGGSGESNLTFPGANSLTNNGQINILPAGNGDSTRLTTAGLVNNGTYFQSGGTAHSLGPITGTGTMTIAFGNAAATRLVQSSLSLSGTSRLTVAPNSLFNSLNSLSIINTAVLNLTNNDLTIDYTGDSAIGVLIGLYSNDRVVANTVFAGLPTYLAISEAADLGLTEFNGQTIDETTVIAKYTYVGDANLDGQVDALDYERIDLAIGNTGAFGTAQGDLNYDGNVDALDYEQVDLNIGNGVGSALAAVTGGVFIPEPTGAAVLVAAGAVMARRRRV